MPIEVAEIERWLDRLYVAAEGASLRQKDRRKAVEVAAMLGEVQRVVARVGASRALILVDAAAGKSYLGLLAAKLVIEPLGRAARVVCIEREPERLALSRAVAPVLDTPVSLEFILGDVRDTSLWPEEASLVMALHACGPASDAVIEGAIATRARALLLVPCCVGAAVATVPRAQLAARDLGIPGHAPVRRRFVESLVAAERALRLEAAGWQTEVTEPWPASVSPENMLFRARYVGEPVRVARARAAAMRLARAFGATETGPAPPATTVEE